MTSQVMLRLPVQSRRDALRARVLARRLAGLFHLETREAILFATGVFILAARLVQHRWRAVVEFRRDASTLRAGVIPLPDGPAAPAAFPEEFLKGEIVRSIGEDLPLAADDLFWLAHWIGERFPIDAFEEMVHLHEELLALSERPKLGEDSSESENAEGTSAA